MLRKLLRILGLAAAGLLGLLVLALIISAVFNAGRRTTSADPERLDAFTLTRLTEFRALQTKLGDTVWPGLGDHPIPVVVYNESTAFLAGIADPPPGWRTVPGGREVGGPWQAVPATAVLDAPLYRQPLPSTGETPQAFTVGVGDEYAASLGTMEWMPIALADQIRRDLPGPLAAVFPYTLFTNELVTGTEHYLSLLFHEAFHAHVAAAAPDRLAAAEASLVAEDGYPWDDPAVVTAWKDELATLAAALRAQTDDEAATLAADFLALRRARRAATGLTPAQVALERGREWSEGLARYAELAIWRAAADPAYRPTVALVDDPDFDDYRGYERRWSRELDQMTRMATQAGEGRFYYTGGGMANLLDRLSPGWKDGAMAPGVYLEDLLADALDARG
jgi:hypothetical protein